MFVGYKEQEYLPKYISKILLHFSEILIQNYFHSLEAELTRCI